MKTIDAQPAAKQPWIAPDYRRISAGSAENGAGTFGDGGGPGANRS
jgi:hypothetical protein